MKKTLVFILTVAMVFALLPAAAFAATQQNVPSENVNQTFDGNVQVVPPNGSEVVFDNCDFINGARLYIDNGNGSNVTIKNCRFSGAVDGEYNYACTIRNAGNVIIENNTVNGSWRAFNVSIYSSASKLTMTGNNITLTTITDPVKAEKNVGIQINGGNWVGENITIAGNIFENATTAFRLHNSFAFATGHTDDVINLGLNTQTNCANYIGKDPDPESTTADQQAAVDLALSNIDIDGDTDVTAAVDPSYMIIIPPSVNFGTLVKGHGVITRNFIVEARDVIIGNGAKVKVTVASSFLMNDGTTTNPKELAYSLYNASGTVLDGANNVFAEFDAANTQSNGHVTVDTNAITAAGSYQGTMTFTITYVG